MQTKKTQDQKNEAIALSVAGVVVGAAVMATVSNHKNQEQAQKMLEKVKDKASSYMNTSREAVEDGKKKVDATISLIQESNKKIPGIWKKQGKV
jgi:uncharacterized membrane-anchored protein YhcB (DUF1043 family)